MHMEKCGGTSLDRLLRDEYADGFVLYDPGSPGFTSIPELPQGIRCVHGHMFYGLHKRFPQQRSEYITLLRNPVERFLSSFEHARRHEHPLRGMVTGHGGFERFCSEHAARHYRNLFVRRLAGVWGEVTQSDLDRAENVLRSFAVVGQLEHSSRFVSTCADRFGWRTRQLAHHNAAPRSGPPLAGYSQEEQQRALAANEWDRQLIERVRDILVR
jgi:hypothetical protein